MSKCYSAAQQNTVPRVGDIAVEPMPIPYFDSPDFRVRERNKIKHVDAMNSSAKEQNGNVYININISTGGLITGILGMAGPGTTWSVHRVVIIAIVLQITGGGEGRGRIEVGGSDM
jgi:hypothetical protein